MIQPAFVSTAAVRGPFPDLESQVGALRDAGISAIELGWSAAPSAASPAEWLLACRGARFLVHNYFPQPREPFVLNLAAVDDGIRERSVAMASANLRLSARLGAPFYSVHAGFAAAFTPESLGQRLEASLAIPRTAALELFQASLARLAAVASESGVDLLIEPNVVDRRNLVDGRNELLLLAEAAEIVDFLRALGHPRVGVLLDTGHLNVTATTLGFDRAAFVEQVAPWVRGLHVHDNDGSADQHRPLTAESWVWGVIRDSRFSRCPMVLESVFPSVTDAAAYRSWFDGVRGLPS